REFADGTRPRLEPENYGVEDGLRSAQCAPTYPVAGGGMRGKDGRLRFTTSRGLAVLDPDGRKPPGPSPLAHLTGETESGHELNPGNTATLAHGPGRIQIRWTGIHLAAPERVHYAYKLERLDTAFVDAGTRRVINYNSLSHGPYRFRLRAEV